MSARQLIVDDKGIGNVPARAENLRRVEGPTVLMPGTAGNYLSVPDETAFQITGSFGLVAKIKATGATARGIAGRYTTTSNLRSWRWGIGSTRQPYLWFSADGVVASSAGNSTIQLPADIDAIDRWVSVTLDDATGDITHWDGGTGDVPLWAVHQTKSTTYAGQFAAIGADLLIGHGYNANGDPFNGNISYFALFDGIGANTEPGQGAKRLELTPADIAATDSDAGYIYGSLGHALKVERAGGDDEPSTTIVPAGAVLLNTDPTDAAASLTTNREYVREDGSPATILAAIVLNNPPSVAQYPMRSGSYVGFLLSSGAYSTDWAGATGESGYLPSWSWSDFLNRPILLAATIDPVTGESTGRAINADGEVLSFFFKDGDWDSVGPGAAGSPLRFIQQIAGSTLAGGWHESRALSETELVSMAKHVLSRVSAVPKATTFGPSFLPPRRIWREGDLWRAEDGSIAVFDGTEFVGDGPASDIANMKLIADAETGTDGRVPNYGRGGPVLDGEVLGDVARVEGPAIWGGEQTGTISAPDPTVTGVAEVEYRAAVTLPGSLDVFRLPLGNGNDWEFRFNATGGVTVRANAVGFDTGAGSMAAAGITADTPFSIRAHWVSATGDLVVEWKSGVDFESDAGWLPLGSTTGHETGATFTPGYFRLHRGSATAGFAVIHGAMARFDGGSVDDVLLTRSDIASTAPEATEIVTTSGQAMDVVRGTSGPATTIIPAGVEYVNTDPGDAGQSIRVPGGAETADALDVAADEDAMIFFVGRHGPNSPSGFTSNGFGGTPAQMMIYASTDPAIRSAPHDDDDDGPFLAPGWTPDQRMIAVFVYFARGGDATISIFDRDGVVAETSVDASAMDKAMTLSARNVAYGDFLKGVPGTLKSYGFTKGVGLGAAMDETRLRSIANYLLRNHPDA